MYQVLIKKEPVQTTCNHCGHTWKFKGKLMFATCPNCQGKVRIQRNM